MKLTFVSATDKTGEQLLVVTTKAMNYHEPAKYLSHLKLVVTSSSSYYIQVHYDLQSNF